MPRAVQSAKARATPQLTCTCGHAKGWHRGWYKLTCNYPGCDCREYHLHSLTGFSEQRYFWDQFR